MDCIILFILQLQDAMAKSTQEIPIKFYDITIDASDFENDVMRLFGELRPQWTRKEMRNEVGDFFRKSPASRLVTQPFVQA